MDVLKIIRRYKLKKRLEFLIVREQELSTAIISDKQSLDNQPENVTYLSSFYRNLENLQMEYADVRDEIRAIKKEVIRNGIYS